MRKSLSDIPNMVDESKEYPCLQADLKPFYAYVLDGGHSLCCIPKCLLEEAIAEDKV